mmetsp:Transcript_22852/g.20755  ORF Transcript_22852/g.20755 Transcript_22852/m.20755 type:complete len:195 (+) Transcript_22852:52-636(+)
MTKMVVEEIPVDVKINMSLDELVKNSVKSKPKKSNTRKSTKLQTKQSQAANSKRNKKINKNAMDIADSNSNKKIAQSVGTNKAKRNALINQKRGISSTNKPTKKEIKLSIQKQKSKARPSILKVVKAKAAPLPPNATMKISFKPADLAKTTDRTVAAQIKNVLSKQKSSKDENKPVVPANPGRKVLITKVPIKK